MRIESYICKGCGKKMKKTDIQELDFLNSIATFKCHHCNRINVLKVIKK